MKLKEFQEDWFDLSIDYKNTVVVEIKWSLTLNREELEQLLELVKQREKEEAAKILFKPGTKFRHRGRSYITVSSATGMAALGLNEQSYPSVPKALFALDVDTGSIVWWASPETNTFEKGWD